MDLIAYINSGILEAHVLGSLPCDEAAEVERLSSIYPKLKQEIYLIEKSIELFSSQFSTAPSGIVTAKIKQKINSLFPPKLHQLSKPQEYQQWLNKVASPSSFDNIHIEEISSSKTSKMVIAWIKKGEENHTHTAYSEHFLIVEGSCIATIGSETKTYQKGDYVQFPVNINHTYKVTSTVPMKVVAALYFEAAQQKQLTNNQATKK